VIELAYYPGCTLKTRARNFEEAALAATAMLGVRLVEMPRWNCCGSVYSLAADDLVHHLAPVRSLIRAKEGGAAKLVTLCAFCYNTLKRADLLMRQDVEKRDALNDFMEEEVDYRGEVEVVHLLEVLRDDIGWERVSRMVKLPLSGLRVAPYYGCTLLRPQEAAIDRVERPTVLQDLLRALGATVVDFPFSTECCGSYQIVSDPDLVEQCARDILGSALRERAEALVLSCPLCDFNLGQAQRQLAAKYADSREVPLLYFTQLLAVGLGLGPEACRFELNHGQPRRLLESKGFFS